MSSDRLRDSLKVYLVTDRSWLQDGERLEDVVRAAIEGGVSMVQLREKGATHDEFVSIARSIKQITDAYDIVFIINDNIDVALEVGADGVHLGASDGDIALARARCGDAFIIGASARDVETAKRAEMQGASYLGVGAVFGTSTKKDAKTINVDILREITSSVDIPVVAIGGVNETNVPRLAKSGVSGVAVISAILAKADKTKAAKILLEEVEEIRRV